MVCWREIQWVFWWDGFLLLPAVPRREKFLFFSFDIFNYLGSLACKAWPGRLHRPQSNHFVSRSFLSETFFEVCMGSLEEHKPYILSAATTPTVTITQNNWRIDLSGSQLRSTAHLWVLQISPQSALEQKAERLEAADFRKRFLPGGDVRDVGRFHVL